MATEDGSGTRIESITVRFKAGDGATREVTVDPDENDALFWSQEAVDKLALPFYVTSRSPEQALAVRRQVDEQMTRGGLIIAAHKRLCTLVVADLTRGETSFGI